MVLIFKTWKLGELQRVWEGLVWSVSNSRREGLCFKAEAPPFPPSLGGLKCIKRKTQTAIHVSSVLHTSD